jgi:hypothetical protein
MPRAWPPDSGMSNYLSEGVRVLTETSSRVNSLLTLGNINLFDTVGQVSRFFLHHGGSTTAVIRLTGQFGPKHGVNIICLGLFFAHPNGDRAEPVLATGKGREAKLVELN